MSNPEARFRIVSTAAGAAGLIGGAAGVSQVILPGLSPAELKREIARRVPGSREEPKAFAAAARELERYFRTGRVSPAKVKLDLSGVGPFRRSVYEALLAIPPGSVVTYAELARRIGRPGAHRSVGTALSRNPLPVFIPCHRVVRTDGGMGGFTAEGGVGLKRRMLALEGALPA